jgi:uncharacterized MAPEG superfamily protein
MFQSKAGARERAEDAQVWNAFEAHAYWLAAQLSLNFH